MSRFKTSSRAEVQSASCDRKRFLFVAALLTMTSLYAMYAWQQADALGQGHSFERKPLYVNLSTALGLPEKYTPPKIYPEHDIMKLPHFKFDSRFKNPCWYDVKNNKPWLRCLPYFYLLGVKKSGTTDLFYRLAQHPDMMPGDKELQWFPRRRFYCNRSDADIQRYVSLMSYKTIKNISKLNVITKKDNSKYHRIVTGDATPANLHINFYWNLLPGNEGLNEPKYVILDYIRHITPDAKIIILFRDPIDRLYSDYFHSYKKLDHPDFPSQEHFHKAVVKGIKLYTKCFKIAPLRACVYERSISQMIKMQVQLGLYSIYWKELIRVFNREKILYLHTEDFANNKSATLERVFLFLKLRKLSDDKLAQVQTAEKRHQTAPHYKKIGPMWNSTRRMLYDFYQPFADEMIRLTGDEKFKLKPP